MQGLSQILLVVVLTLGVSNFAGYPIARQSKDSSSLSGSISGRVTLNGKPVPGVPVVLTRNALGDEDKPVAKITTGQDGRFRIANVPAGSFKLSAFAPAYVYDERFGLEGKRMTVSPGEAIEGVEVSLRRGGVITGRVSDLAGRPVIEETVTLTMIDEQGRQQGFDIMWQNSQTDDRGVYRIFGVPEGRYVVSVGQAPNQRSAPVGPGNAYYPMTFHPGVTDESRAAVIELAAGAEATGVDIVLGRAAKAYTASGRIVDAETGKPARNVSYGYGILYDGRGISLMGWGGSRSDAQGSFRLERLTPNHYAAFIVKDNDTDHYSDITSFDITDADVSGLEIKVRRGSSISGVAAIDGLTGGDAAEKLSGLRIGAFIQSPELGAPGFGSPPNIAPDGSFRITGLRAGKVKLALGGYPLPKGFALTRVERDGVEQRDGSFNIAAGEQLSGVRITIAYGTAVIRGQLKITGETVPEGTTFSVRLKRAGVDSSRPDWWTDVDDRNRFLFEDLPPGDYEVIVSGYIAVPGAPASRLPEVKKRVTVTNDGETEITIVIDPSTKDN